MKAFPRHAETTADVTMSAEALFFFLDDQRNLSAHMSGSSWMMFGSRMDIYLDADRARAVGSRFGFKGAIFGLPVRVDEIVAEREPPRRKVWDTVGEPSLWVIGPYRMGFEITALASTSRMRVSIEYALPKAGVQRLLGAIFGGIYARWCTRRMVTDAQGHFSNSDIGASHIVD